MGSVGTEVSRQQATHRVMPICRCRARAPRWFPGRCGTTRRYPRGFTTVHKLDGFRFVSRWRDGRRCLLSEVERETLLVVFVTSKSLQYFTSYRGIPTPRIQRRGGGDGEAGTCYDTRPAPTTPLLPTTAAVLMITMRSTLHKYPRLQSTQWITVQSLIKSYEIFPVLCLCMKTTTEKQHILPVQNVRVCAVPGLYDCNHDRKDDDEPNLPRCRKKRCH